MEIDVIESYLKFVEEIKEKYDHIGDIIIRDTIYPEELNRALAEHYTVSTGVYTEYKRKDIEYNNFLLEYSEWWDTKFEEAKKEVMAEYKTSGSVKPSVKEFETRVRINNRKEYNEFERKKMLLYAEVRYYNSLRYRVDGYRDTLETISQNMRSEMYALNLESRANKPVNKPKRQPIN